MPQEAAALAADAAGASRTRPRSRFFMAAAVVLLAVVLVGFARTFFLRPFFDALPAPGYVYVHGIFVATWFLLVVGQTFLIAADRTSLHRRLRIAGALVAVAIVILSLNAVLRYPARIIADEVEAEAQVVAALPAVIWLDLVALALFPTFVAAALFWRQRADVHKRFMLLASIAIIGPATARLTQMSVAMPALGAFFTALPLLLPFALVAHDLVANRRLHRVTLIGVAVVVVANLVGFAVAFSPVGRGLIATLQ